MTAEKININPPPPHIPGSLRCRRLSWQRAAVEAETELSQAAAVCCLIGRKMAGRACSPLQESPADQAVKHRGSAMKGFLEEQPASLVVWLFHALAHFRTGKCVPAHFLNSCAHIGPSLSILMLFFTVFVFACSFVCLLFILYMFLFFS